MAFISVFNDVLGPVMRGPSSSHTAGSYRIGKIAGMLFGTKPESVTFTFDPEGSYCKTYKQQGVDLGFTAGLLGMDITDSTFKSSLETGRKSGLNFEFNIEPIKDAGHPNTVMILMKSENKNEMSLKAKSTGGGSIVIEEVNGHLVNYDGKKFLYIVENCNNPERCKDDLGDMFPDAEIEIQLIHEKSTMIVQSGFELDREQIYRSEEDMKKEISLSRPVFYLQKGIKLFESSEEMIRFAVDKKITAGQAAIKYESDLLCMNETEVMDEMMRRFSIMKDSVYFGLDDKNADMKLLNPTARRVLHSEAAGKTAIGGIHTRAASMAMAAMHTSNSMGVVCAAPTGGAAGVIPGVMTALSEDLHLTNDQIVKGLFAASAVGLAVAERATFAAEVAGCQVEIGAAGAMAAAAVVEIAGGSAEQAMDAAAISFQNTMGSVCDLVQGICELPCHTRNAAAASSAFVCADLILGGYENPVSLDETIDAVYKVGKMLPRELRCTALGGLAATPSARKLKKK